MCENFILSYKSTVASLHVESKHFIFLAQYIEFGPYHLGQECNNKESTREIFFLTVSSKRRVEKIPDKRDLIFGFVSIYETLCHTNARGFLLQRSGSTGRGVFVVRQSAKIVKEPFLRICLNLILLKKIVFHADRSRQRISVQYCGITGLPALPESTETRDC